jgi:hypothetical protein
LLRLLLLLLMLLLLLLLLSPRCCRCGRRQRPERAIKGGRDVRLPRRVGVLHALEGGDAAPQLGREDRRELAQPVLHVGLLVCCFGVGFSFVEW